MEEELLTCKMEYVSISVFIVISVLVIIGLRKLIQSVFELLRSRKILNTRPNIVDINLHREIEELRKTTLQISDDWGAMVSSITSLKDQEIMHQEKLKSEIKSMGDVLLSSVRSSIEGEYTRNETRMTNISKIISIFNQDMNAVKEMIRDSGEILLKSIEQYRPSNKNMTHMWAQTEKEIIVNRIPQDGSRMDEENGENDPPKPSIKKVLSEIHRQVRKSASKDRQEVMSVLETILSQMSQDRELIKNTIQQAFATSTYQNTSCFDRFNSVGQEALHYMSEKHEKLHTFTKDKFEELDKKLKGIFEQMRATGFDVSSIKSTMDNIDSQLDDIYKEIELGTQRNVEQCEEVLGGLEMATDVWKDSSSRVTNIATVISILIKNMELLSEKLYELNGKLDPSKEVGREENSPLIDSSAFQQEMTEYQTNMPCFLNMQSMIESSTKKLFILNDRLENGTRDIKMAIENLLRQIRFVSELVESVGERVKVVEMETSQKKSIDAPSFKQDENLQGDANTNAVISKAPTVEDTPQANNCRVVGDTIVKSPKKVKPILKIKPPSSPTKKGKTIFSGLSPSNLYNKNLEQRRKQR